MCTSGFALQHIVKRKNVKYVTIAITIPVCLFPSFFVVHNTFVFSSCFNSRERDILTQAYTCIKSIQLKTYNTSLVDRAPRRYHQLARMRKTDAA